MTANAQDSISVHEFLTDSLARVAVATIDAGEHIPVPGGLTVTCCEVLSHQGMFYIIADATTRKYLHLEKRILFVPAIIE